ncbi:MAG: hypothetical protein ACKPKO_25395, partial [Candidatus Fonsibacter sp.]
MKFHWNAIIFLDGVLDVDDICFCGEIIHYDGFPSERSDKDLSDGRFCVVSGLKAEADLPEKLFQMPIMHFCWAKA